MNEIVGSYNLLLVLLSFLISVFGSYTSLQVARHIPHAREDRAFWVGSAAFAMGGGAIWSMHFIGMVAFDLGIPVRYDPVFTVGSLILAVATTAVGFLVVGGEAPTFPRLLVGGTAMGLGIVTMHYTGMAGMRMAADLTYAVPLVVASAVIGVAASCTALAFAFRSRPGWSMVGVATLMGVGVCGMHYTAMAAASFSYDPGRAALRPPGLAPDALAYGVFLISVVVLSVALAVSRPSSHEDVEAA